MGLGLRIGMSLCIGLEPFETGGLVDEVSSMTTGVDPFSFSFSFGCGSFSLRIG